MNRIKETPPCERPREKLVKNGPSCLSDAELIAVILGSGIKGHDVTVISKQVNRYLKEHMTSLSGDCAGFMVGLRQIKGLGMAKAGLLAAMHELFSRLAEVRSRVVKNAKDVLPFISFIAGKRQEHFVAVNLNGGNRMLSTKVVTIGLLDQALVHPREVFSEAVKDRAAKLIVAHNHPAGGLVPSAEDIQITKNLLKASRILGIPLLDHIIVSEEGYMSFREEGLM